MEFSVTSDRGLVISGFDPVKIAKHGKPENVKLFREFQAWMTEALRERAPAAPVAAEVIASRMPRFRSAREEAKRRGWSVVK
jgi:hypothetical protein